jgi:hypothetical protein
MPVDGKVEREMEDNEGSREQVGLGEEFVDGWEEGGWGRGGGDKLLRSLTLNDLS